MRECDKCGDKGFKITPQIFSDGTEHMRRSCLECGKFLDYAMKNIPAAMFVMPFGKHKGKNLQWIAENDIPYARWLQESSNRPSIADRMTDVLFDLKIY